MTVLFADLVGSTSLEERLDAESVHRLVGRFHAAMREAIERHDGRVVKFIGDGVMAAFGVPAVREDDALRAARAAAAMVDSLDAVNAEVEREWGVRLQMRTGVNTGEVVVTQGEDDVVGDPVNVAARLEAAAGVGEVLMGLATMRLVRDHVRLEPVEPLRLKGKSEPVPAFRLLSVDMEPPRAGGARIEAPLVGRDSELARLRAVFDQAVAERGCRLVTVVGSPGLGKTRLAHELAEAVAGEAAVVQSCCEPTGEGITFQPVADALRGAVGIGEADAAEAARAKLAALLPGDGDSGAVIERALGVLGAAPAASTEETFWAVRRLLEAIAAQRPLVVVLDDLHWGQPTFLDLIEHLVEWTRDAPLLLVGLARPELRDVREALAGPRRAADVIELRPLGEADSQALVSELVGRADLPPALAARVLEATEGNPLFVGEMLRMLVDEGILRREGHAWVAASDAAQVEVPPTIQALLAARLERLAGDERSVVERAAVIGKQFYRGAVAELAPAPVRAGLDGHLEALRRRELVEPDGTYWIDEPVFRFHHVLIRDAAYGSLLKEARAELHERFADWLEAKAGERAGEHEEVIAFHLEQAHEYRRQLGLLDDAAKALGSRAGERLASAGRRALAREDLPAAVNLLRRALDRIGEEPARRQGALTDLAEALLSAGDTRAAAPIVEALRSAAGDDRRLTLRAAVYAGQLAYLSDSSRLRETAEAVGAAAEELAALGDSSGVAKARHVEAGALARMGRVAAAEGALDAALAAAREAGDARRVSAVLAGAPLAALWGPSRVVRASGRCLDVVRILRMSPGSRHLEASALGCQAVLEAMRGRADAARAMLGDCRTSFEELGLRFELLETEVHAGIVELLDGDFAEAGERLRSAYEGFAALGAGTETARAAALLARALLEQGDDAGAEELTQASEESGGEDLKAAIAWRGVRAEVLARRGEHAAAEELALRAVALAEDTDALTDHADARMALAAVLREAGRAGDAAEEAKRALGLYLQKENEAGARRAAAFAGADPSAVWEPGPEPAAVVDDDWLGVARRWCDAFNARDWRELADCVTEDIVAVNHRQAATWDRVEGRDAEVELQRALAAASGDARYRFDGVEMGGDVGIGRLTLHGRLDQGGGEWSMEILTAARRRGNRLERMEIFDRDDMEGARACADRLRSPVAEDAGDASPNAQLGRRVVAAVNARDWDGFERLLTEDFVAVDQRASTPAERRRDRRLHLDLQRRLAELAPDFRASFELVAEIGQVLWARYRLDGHWADGGSEFRIDMGLLVAAQDGRFERFEFFDPDDVAGALRRFGELLGEPSLVTCAGWARAYDAREWDAVETLIAPDVVLVDRRSGLGGGAEFRGRDAVVRRWRQAAELAPDLRIGALVPLEASGGGALMSHRGAGHLQDGAGRFEIEFLFVGATDGGRLARAELFDSEDLDAARSRFQELGGGRVTTRCRELTRRYLSAYNARDWAALEAHFEEDYSIVDHRATGFWGMVSGGKKFVERVRSLVDLAPDVRMEAETVATGLHAGVWKQTARGHLADGGGEFSSEMTFLTLASEDRARSSEIFEFEDISAALRRFEEVGAATEAERLYARVCRLVGERDWDALTACYAPEAEILERREVGWETVSGRDAIVDVFRTWIQVVPDGRLGFEALGGDDDVIALRLFGHGHAAQGGGPMEYDVCQVATVRDGRIVRGERFDADEERAAVARLEELAAATR